MKLEIFNTLTDKKGTFVPIVNKKASLYVCGPTVYNHAHIGNFRPIIVFSLLKNLLVHLGYKTTLVSNYTDIDDRIIKKAQEEGVPESVISDRYIKAYEDVLKSLYIKKPDIQPRVSNYIHEIISYIQNIVDNGSGYVCGGDVFFRVSSVPCYGCLSNIKLDQNEVGARIEENINKENPSDFVVWKQTNIGLKWPSPWGEGRPGWHTECSVMINSIFSNGKIDFHGGGFDLKFPHHENEIAQSYAVNKHSLANFWLHNGFINIDGAKMSKSLGNVLLGKDAVSQYGGNTVKFAILNTHYRAPISLTDETFESASNELDKILGTYNSLSVRIQLQGGKLRRKSSLDDLRCFFEFLCDDLNVSNSLTVVYKMLKAANQLLRNPKTLCSELENYYAALYIVLSILGLDTKTKKLNLLDQSLYAAYENARNEKNYAKSDEIRAILVERKILI